jgi:hypothetical protein
MSLISNPEYRDERFWLKLKLNHGDPITMEWLKGLCKPEEDGCHVIGCTGTCDGWSDACSRSHAKEAGGDHRYRLFIKATEGLRKDLQGMTYTQIEKWYWDTLKYFEIESMLDNTKVTETRITYVRSLVPSIPEHLCCAGVETPESLTELVEKGAIEWFGLPGWKKNNYIYFLISKMT